MTKTIEINQALVDKLNAMRAVELIEWALTTFGSRAAIGTSFQLTGTVIIDIASKKADNFRVFTIDTLRLHPETYKIIKKVEERYGIEVERFKPDEKKLKQMIDRFGEYLFFTDKAKQEYCCEVRKVEPNVQAIATLDCWITGLRKDQSSYRIDVKKAMVISDNDRQILKLNPLADWDKDRVQKYIDDNELPYNELFDQGYDSIGCVLCSTPLAPGEPPRSGRWRWFNQMKIDDDKKECGIHLNVNDKKEGEK